MDGPPGEKEASKGRRTEMANIDRAEYAAELKNHRGHNCCQAVTAALADETDMPRDISLR